MKTSLSILLSRVGLLFAGAFAWGWVWNILKLIHMAGGDVTTMFILRVIGIFAPPLGAILGFF